jgi:hypothetical protein
MSWKFNPPPGWPAQPEGWQPPPGWAPDPSWPPAPPGWQFWVPATATPEPAPPASPAPTVHDAPTSLANPTVPVQSSPAGSYEPAPPYSPGAPHSPLATPSPAASYPPAGPYPPASGPSHPPAGAFPPPGSYPSPGGYPPPSGPQAPVPPAGGTPWYQRGWAGAGAALAVLLVGCMAGGAVAVLTDEEGDPTADPPTNTAPPPAPTGPPASESPDPDPGGGGEALGPGEEQSGEGPTIIPIDLPTDSLHTVTMEYSGDGFFSSSLVDEAGDIISTLGSTEFGDTDYSGTWPLDVGLFGLGPAAAIDITNADSGTWTVRIQDISEAPVWPDVTEGTGDTVLQVDGNAVGDSTRPQGTHDGASNFIVWAYSGEEDFNDRLLFNLIGEVNDDAAESFSSDQVILHVQADGNWTLTPP